MSVHPSFPLSAETTLPDLNFTATRMVMLHEAEEHGLKVLADTDTCVTVETDFGVFHFEATDQGIRAQVAAAKPDWLYVLKESLVEHIEHSVPEVAKNIRWSDTETVGARPPNFHFVAVYSVEKIGTSFLRLRLKAKDFTSFADDAIHFRFVLPPEGLPNIEWPHVAPNGATIWPKGDKAVHKPVYTSRWVDREAGFMDVDIFIHQGGRVSDWAATVAPGTQIGVIGPGGGGVVDTSDIHFFGDETAFPAIARLLESMPSGTKGTATLLAANGAACGYDIAAPDGIALNWLTSEQSDLFQSQALNALKGKPNAYFWYAADKSKVQTIRAAAKTAQRPTNSSYIAAYWSE
ncbi:siderophore-interacting protein [Ascidiaceihabitans sp.]|uniref:siderophore-interacting protein n=1 Tax=Ascidiaceihabitans sp. TaxID=1872644 RepID=UPI00329A2353